MSMTAAHRALRAKSIALLVTALLALPAIAQQPASTTPQPELPVYDVVSIHPHSALDNSTSFNSRPGNFAATNATLKQLISYAYGIREDLIYGLPGWADSAHFDVTAKASDFDPSAFKNLTREQRESLLLPMLTDRFHVRAHTEIKTLAVFNLVLTKDGPKFQKSPSPPPIDPDHPAPNGQLGRGGIYINNNDLTANAVPLSMLAEILSEQLNHTVIDKTSLTGDYDLKLKWTPDEESHDAADNGAADHPPDLFTALQEQLGLKLDPAKGPVTTLVVDHAEQPTPN
jgi:uncharacterized protein (TIGR03435 family)